MRHRSHEAPEKTVFDRTGHEIDSMYFCILFLHGEMKTVNLPFDSCCTYWGVIESWSYPCSNRLHECKTVWGAVWLFELHACRIPQWIRYVTCPSSWPHFLPGNLDEEYLLLLRMATMRVLQNGHPLILLRSAWIERWCNQFAFILLRFGKFLVLVCFNMLLAVIFNQIWQKPRMNDEEAGVSSKTASPRSAFSRLELGMEFANALTNAWTAWTSHNEGCPGFHPGFNPWHEVEILWIQLSHVVFGNWSACQGVQPQCIWDREKWIRHPLTPRILFTLPTEMEYDGMTYFVETCGKNCATCESTLFKRVKPLF